MCILLKKHLILVQKISYGFGGYPLPFFTDKIFSKKGVMDLGNPSPTTKRFPEAQVTSPGSREISRAEGMDFPIPPEFWWSTDILLIINSSTGMDQEIHPSGQGRIDSVKINPSLLRMREYYFRYTDAPGRAE